VGFFNAPVTREVWKRVILIFMLVISVVFNYILYNDNLFLTLRHDIMEAGFVDDYVGHSYCDSYLEDEEDG
jgi:hypothetical protein